VAQTLMKHGWKEVHPLLGGFDAWRRAGFPTEAKPERQQSYAEVAENIRNAEGDDGGPEG
jgi:3-mercaptopyruvate sulfurtransferase SseA